MVIFVNLFQRGRPQSFVPLTADHGRNRQKIVRLSGILPAKYLAQGNRQ
jgi:hypothetical protein